MKGKMLIDVPYITGKWSKERFKVIKPLGMGGTATVYLVYGEQQKKYFALKAGTENLSINREYHMLKQFEKTSFVVNVYGIDDCEVHGRLLHFLLLEYIPGLNLKAYSRNKPMEAQLCLTILMVMLKGLEYFHRMGYILGDLKLENIMIDEKNHQLKLIDLGGVVRLGEGIKEYTPAYDRACWHCGIRRAEISYEYFALTMMLIRLLLGEKLNPYRQTKKQLMGQIMALSISNDLKQFIVRSLNQEKTLLEGFEKRINELYNIEGQCALKMKKKKLDINIQRFFAASLGLMLLTVLLIFLTNY